VSSIEAVTSNSIAPYTASSLRPFSRGSARATAPATRELASAPVDSPAMKPQITSTNVNVLDPKRSTKWRIHTTW
jgi:hypothetical protein